MKVNAKSLLNWDGQRTSYAPKENNGVEIKLKMCKSSGDDHAVILAGRSIICRFLAGESSNLLIDITIFLTKTYINFWRPRTIWHDICSITMVMVAMRTNFDEINVLASQAEWAWPRALRDIFAPRGINLLMAGDTTEFIDVIEHKRIHATIIDLDSKQISGLATIKIIRMGHPLLPCLLLKNQPDQALLGEALSLDVFSVIDKPVDMSVLLGQLNKLFTKKYNSDIFSRMP